MNIANKKYTSFLKNNITIKPFQKVSTLVESQKHLPNDDIKTFNYFLDKIYIISLKRCVIRRELCMKQLQALCIDNYEFVDAIDTTSLNDIKYNVLYEDATSKMNKDFIKHNFKCVAY
jgi:hypothetical protein